MFGSVAVERSERCDGFHDAKLTILYDDDVMIGKVSNGIYSVL